MSLKVGVLRKDIKLLRGEETLLFDPGADAYFKVSQKFIEVISFMTEDMPVEDFQKKLAANGVVISIEELQEIIIFLKQNNLQVPAYGEMSIKKQNLEKVREKTRFLRFCSAYLFFRLPPWRPEKFFSAIRPYVSFLASKTMLILLMIPAISGYLLAIRNAGLIKTEFADSLSWGGLVKYVMAIILLKIFHEAAHSLAAIHFNCRVRGIGIGFMFFIPRLYTDTTDSYRLGRRKRLLIDAAGIIVELLIGGIAALLWCNMAPGVAKSTMFYIFTVSTISTLLVNGNPFIRYDGYYILSDLLGVDNLMGRANLCLRDTWRRYFLHLGEPSREEKKSLLLLFGIGSFIYRIFLYTSICMLIYYKFTKVVALLMLIMEFYSLLIYHAIKEVRAIWQLSRKSTGRAVYFISAFIILAICGVFFLPISWGISMYGESVPKWRIPVTVEESGYLRHELYSGGKMVKEGEKIVSLSSPQLLLAIEKIKKMLAHDALLYELQSIDENEFNRLSLTEQKKVSDQIALDELERRKKLLDITAERSGFFVSSLVDLTTGAYLPRNTTIGKIVSSEIIIYGYSNDRDIGKIQIGLRGKAYISDMMKTFNVKVVRIEKVAAKLEKSALMQSYGGPIPVYPDGKDFKTVQTLYRIELALDGEEKILPGRVIKIELMHKAQLYKELKAYLLSFFRKEF